MTRTQVTEQFDVDAHGIIHTSGKFEGEMLYAPYLYDCSLDGGEMVFVLDASDKLEFPELIGVYGIAIEESEQGFVHIATYDTQAEYDADINTGVYVDDETDQFPLMSNSDADYRDRD
jgi:hypothetical protein